MPASTVAVPLLAILATTPVWLPYLDPALDLWPTQDAENHLLRLYALEHLLRQGLVYPRWLPDLFHGFGQPLTNYYAPGFYYLAIWLHWATRTDLYGGFQLGGALVVCLAAAGMATLVHRLTGNRAAALFAAAVYAFSPYPFPMNLYYRGALPEALAAAFLPWAALGFVETARCGCRAAGLIGPPRRVGLGWLALGAFAAAAAILAHNMLGPLVLVTALGFGLLAALTWKPAVPSAAADGAPAPVGRPGLPEPSRFPNLPGFSRGRRLGVGRVPALTAVGLAATAALGLSAFFWVPVVAERGAVRLDDVITKDHVDYRAWLLDPTGSTERTRHPDYAYTRTGPVDWHVLYPYAPFQPIKPSWAQLAPLLLIGGLLRRRGAAHAIGAGGGARLWPLSMGAGALALAAWWITTTSSRFLWDHVGALQSLQFTYRPLGLMTFGVAFVGGHAAARLRTLQPLSAALLLLLASSLAANALAARFLPAVAAATGSTAGAAASGAAGRAARTIDAVRFRSLDQTAGYLATTAREEFMPRTARVDVFSATDPRAHLYRTLYPESSWIGGLLLPYRGQTGIAELSAGGLEMRAQVATGAGGGAVAVRQLDFPGWTAYLDGKRVAHGQMPYRQDVQATLGFVLVDVPAGTHELAVSFESTPARLAGQVVSALTLAIVLAVAGYAVRRRRRQSAADLLPGTTAARSGLAALIPVACWLTGVALVAHAAFAVGDQWARTTSGRAPHVPLTRVLVADLARAAQEGRATLESPTGAALGPDRFVDLSWLQLGATDETGAHGGALRRWLYLHPPARASLDLEVPQGAVFQAGLALDPATWHTDVGDGVRFIVEARELRPVPAAQPVVLLDRHVNPRARTEERGWNDVTVDLSRWAGKRVQLTLRTDAADNLAYDWAGWGNPVVVVRTSARWS